MKARWAPILLFTLLLNPAAHSPAEDFRVETDVFVGEAQQPAIETLTLFFGDVVYDFLLTDPREITVLDLRRRRVVLLDPERKLKTTLTTDELMQFSAAIRSHSAGSDQPPLFGTKFVGHVDEQTGEVLLEGENLTYRANVLQPKFQSAAQRYREFADWYARLNAARPGNPPPFGRLELNRRLAEQGSVPEAISRTIRLPGRLAFATKKARSQHAFTWLLSTTDRKRIEVAGKHIVDFEAVGLSKFWQLDPNGADRGN